MAVPTLRLRGVAVAVALTVSVVCTAAIDSSPTEGAATFPPHLRGSTDAVTALLERVLPGSASHFELSIVPGLRCPGTRNIAACFTLTDAPGGGKTAVAGTSASELTGGLGVYLREYCNMTIGWERGGGSKPLPPAPMRASARAHTHSRSLVLSLSFPLDLDLFFCLHFCPPPAHIGSGSVFPHLQIRAHSMHALCSLLGHLARFAPPHGILRSPRLHPRAVAHDRRRPGDPRPGRAVLARHAGLHPQLHVGLARLGRVGALHRLDGARR